MIFTISLFLLYFRRMIRRKSPFLFSNSYICSYSLFSWINHIGTWTQNWYLCLVTWMLLCEYHLHHSPCFTGRLKTSILLCTADSPGYNSGPGQAAHTKRNLQSHNKELPLLQDCRQRLAGGCFPNSFWPPLQPSAQCSNEAANNSCLCSISELDPSQLVVESLLHQSGSITGGARQRFVLEDRPLLRGQAHWAGLQEEKAPRCTLLQDPPWSALLQVCLYPTFTHAAFQLSSITQDKLTY